jgi:hypothetical protein
MFKVNVTNDMASGSDTVEGKQKINRRKDRKIDIDSVRVTYLSDKGCNNDTSINVPYDQTGEHFGASDTDHLYGLKEDIDSGRQDESGFFNLLRRAWDFSKEKLKCIIL